MNLSNRAYLGLNEFERINWLPINDRVEQCISSMIFNCFNNLSPACMNDVFKPSNQNSTTATASSG